MQISVVEILERQNYILRLQAGEKNLQPHPRQGIWDVNNS